MQPASVSLDLMAGIRYDNRSYAREVVFLKGGHSKSLHINEQIGSTL